MRSVVPCVMGGQPSIRNRLAVMRQSRWHTTMQTNENPNQPIVGLDTLDDTDLQMPKDVLTGQPLINRIGIQTFTRKRGLSSHLWIKASQLHLFTKDKLFQDFRVKNTTMDGFFAGNSKKSAEYAALEGKEKAKYIEKNRSLVFFNLSQIDKPEALKDYAHSKAPMYADSSWPPRFSMQFAMLKHAEHFGLSSRYWISERILSRIYGDEVRPKENAVGLRCYFDTSRSLTMQKGPNEVKLFTLDQTTDPEKLERRAQRGAMLDLSSGRRLRFECQNQLYTVAEANGYSSLVWFPSSHIHKLERLHVELRKRQKGTLVMLNERNPVEYFNADQTQDPERVRQIFYLVKAKFKRFLNAETGEALSKWLYKKCVKAIKKHSFDSDHWLSSFQLVKLKAKLKEGEKAPFSVSVRNRQAAFYNMDQIENAKEILRASARMRFQKG